MIPSRLGPTPRNTSSSRRICSAIFSGYRCTDRLFVAEVSAAIDVGRPARMREKTTMSRTSVYLCAWARITSKPEVIRVATVLAHHRGGDRSLRLHTHRPGFSWQQLSIVSSVFSGELVRRAAAVGSCSDPTLSFEPILSSIVSQYSSRVSGQCNGALLARSRLCAADFAHHVDIR
jgi:hypothetical protein